MTTISILNVSKQAATTKGGKAYNKLEIAYKDLSYQGAVKSKVLMPFGEQAGAFKKLENAQSGEVYEITVVKNAQGYNDWLDAVATSAEASTTTKTTATGGQRASTFETPEERAKKQVYIIRQSSIANAVAALAAGAKSTPKVEDILSVAKQFENYVLNIEPQAKDVGDVSDDEFEDVPL